MSIAVLEGLISQDIECFHLSLQGIGGMGVPILTEEGGNLVFFPNFWFQGIIEECCPSVAYPRGYWLHPCVSETGQVGPRITYLPNR